MRFSRRTPADFSENPLTAALRRRTEPYLDLTVSNPTAAGLSPGDDELHEALAGIRPASYRPDSRGLRSAREAIAAEYLSAGAAISPDRLILTASTSEAYAFLFKLLADPGEAVLVPQPSYPLFEHLLRLEGLREETYALRASAIDGRWSVDLASVERGLDETIRVLLSVHPNNPTGSYTRKDDRARILSLLDPDSQAFVSDEVFFDFPVEGAPERAGFAAAAAEGPLAFSLGGLSKSCGLPQMKLAWIAVGGDPARVEEALPRLELVADTYLSVATPVQEALPALFAVGKRAAERIRARVRTNLAALDRALAGRKTVRLPVEAGWSVMVRVPSPPGTDPATALLERDGVLVQPGWFFDAPDDVVVASLIVEPAVFAEGVSRIAAAG